MPERWKWVVGYEGYYEVSSEGRVRSVDRVIPSGWGTDRHQKGRILVQTPNGDPYKSPDVTLSKLGKLKTFRVHWLVMRAFKGKAPPGMEVCHNDGDVDNCRLTNLRYDTSKGNHADRKKHGTNNFGSKNGAAILTEAIVKQIKQDLKKPVTQVSIARKFGLSPQHVNDIKRGKIWSHIA